MKKRNLWKRIREKAPISLRDGVIFLILMATASAICMLLRKVSTSDVHVPMIFVLAVMIVSLLTEGYFYGILAAAVSVIMVNYAFTYPYEKLDFTIYGYPLTFVTMLAVGFVTSTLISRVKQQERVRIESEKEKVRANLLRAVSHDLRTPLTSIGGAISAVIDNDGAMTDQEKETLLSDALKECEWLGRVVENFLSVTRISDDTWNNLNKSEELLEEVISEAADKFHRHIPGVKVKVSVPDEPLFVSMDALLIEQVILNLMDNAVLHGRETSEISVTAAKAGRMVGITVEDDGGGIRPELMERLFSGQIQTESDQNDGCRGMGIGLTVCRTIVEIHGGTIRANNGESGAVFTFTLPLEE